MPLFQIRGKLSPRTDALIGFVGIATVVAIWCFLTYGGFIKPFFLPSPTRIFEGVQRFDERHWLWPAILNSSWRVTRSLLLVIAIGVPLGVLMGAFAPVDAFTRKLINAGKSVPTTGLVGLVVLWFAVEEKAKTVFLFIGAIFYMIILVRQAVLSVPEEYLHVGLDVGLSKWQLIRRVLLPGALPQIWDAIAVCNGIMWTYIVLAEFINSSEDQIGLGYLLVIGSRHQEAGEVFATLILVGLISAVTDWLLTSIRRRFFNW